jgi:hypothetical protein
LGGDIGRSVLDIMRGAGAPVSVSEIAERLLIDRHLSTNDERVAKAARKQVYSSLRHYMTQDVVRPADTHGNAQLWEIKR